MVTLAFSCHLLCGPECSGGPMLPEGTDHKMRALSLPCSFSSCELAQVSADTLSLSWAAWSTFLLLWISSCNLKMNAQRFNKNKGLTVKAGIVLHGTVPSFRENEICFLG